ncbi:MAG: adenosylcobinamide-phosphate synthase [Psychrobacter glaciei]|jgi:adenosylcobinamide-phosphate synthase
MISILIALSLCLDELLGEAKRFHPLVIFARYANWIERLTYKNKFNQGVIAWCLSIIPVVIFFIVIEYLLFVYCNFYFKSVFEIIILYFTIGQKSLKQHAKAVFTPLINADVPQARIAVSMIVSRDTKTLNQQQLATATIETVTENTHDAVIGPLVFFVMFGIPGAVLFRLTNTLDAMWGYRSEKYEKFGKFSARADDVLGFIPARVTVFFMLLSRPQNLTQTISSVWNTGRRWYSPNAGIVMAAGAGALNVRLGGDAVYHGQKKTRLDLGFGNLPYVKDIHKSIRLMYSCSCLFVISIGFVEWLI